MNFIFATHNSNKVAEVAKIINNPIVAFQSLKEIGYTEDIEETGITLDENAWIKADHIHSMFGGNVVAEDTGLEVEELNMEPGVYSARYAGPAKDSEKNMDLLLERLGESNNRRARFRTVIASYINGQKFTFEGIINGTIAHHRMGSGGFGYDPIFIPEGYNTSFGELSLAIKNEISHRGRAFQKLNQCLNELLNK